MNIFKLKRFDFFDAVYFRRGLTCSLGLTNDLIDGGQWRATPHLRKVKPKQVLKIGTKWLLVSTRGFS